MEHFDSSCRGKDLLAEAVLVQSVGCQAQAWTDSLSSDLDHVPERVVKSRRLRCECQIVKQLLQSSVDMGFLYHNIVYYILQR